MPNKVEFKIIVSEKGLQITQKGVDKLGTSLKETQKEARGAGSAASELDYKIRQGIIGSSSAARSFSKLNQTIGRGPGSLVSSYATLAANTFAVVAAFNALREAAGVEQILRGLEVQGAKTGRTLSIAAEELKNITGAAVSTADALRATAQVNAAGFGAEELQKLGEVATNAALALGRSIPDALERITRGVTKLEPELLDELGLMTKLTEASEKFALANNKTVQSLSSFEKRQAFLNAIVEEGTLKFQGIKDEIGTNPYDKLAASFDNLVKKIFNFANIVGKTLADLGALNEGVLFGGILLFASTISRQLIPALYTLGEAALENRLALLEEAEAAKAAAIALRDKAQADRVAALESARNIKVTDQYPKKFKEVSDALRTGTASSKEFEVAIRSLNASIRLRGTQLRNIYAGTEQEGEKRQIIKDLAETRRQVIALQRVEAEYGETVVKTSSEARAAIRKTNAIKLEARAQGTRAAAIEAAGNLKLNLTWTLLTKSVLEYAGSLELARRASLDLGKTQSLFGSLLDKLKVGAFALGTGIRAIGAAAIRLLPQLGLLTIGISLVQEAYSAIFQSEDDKKKKKALEDYIAVVDSTDAKLRQLEKTQRSLGTQANVTTQYLVAQANTITELAGAALDAITEIEKRIEAERTGSGVPSYFETVFGDSRDLASYATGVAKDSNFINVLSAELERRKSINPINRVFEQVLNPILENTPLRQISKESATTLKAIDQLSKVVDQDLFDALLKSYGGAEKLVSSKALQKAFLSDLKDAYEGVSSSVKTLEEAFKQAETASTEFIRGRATSTSFDKLLSTIQAVNTGIIDIKNNATTNPADLAGLISGIGPDTQRLLSVQNQELINQAKLQFDIKSRLEEQKRVTGDLSAQDDIRLTNSKRLLDYYALQSGTLVDNLRVVESDLENQQNLARLNKLRIESINTILSANKRAYAEGADAARARIKREDEIKTLQEAQLQAELAQNKLIAARIQAKLDEYKLELQLSEEKAKIERELVRQRIEGINKVARAQGLTESEIADPGRRLQQFAGAGLTDQQKLVLQRLAAEKEIFDYTEKQLQTYKNLKTTEDALIDIKAAGEAIAQSIANIDRSRLDSAQKAAEIAEAELKVRQQLRDAYKSNSESIISITQAQEKYNDLLSGISRSPLYGIRDITQQAAKDIRKIGADAQRDIEIIEQSIKTLQADRARASREGEEAEVRALGSQIKLREQALQTTILERDLNIENVKWVERTAILEKALIDSRTEGLEIQKKGLEVLQSYYNEQEKALQQSQQLYSLGKEIAALRNNSEISDQAQKAINYKAAQEQLSLAKDQLEIKKLGIELEYEVLEAQRKLLVYELEAKKEILIQTAKLSGANTNYLNRLAAQMQASIDNISVISYNEVKQLALSNADRELQILERQTEKARLEFLNVFRPESFSDKVKQGIENASTVLETILSTRIQKSAEVTEKTLTPVVTPMDRLTSATIELTSVMTDAVKVFQERLADTLPRELATYVGQGIARLPISGRITGTFGENRGDHRHSGIDIAAPMGTAVPATATGRVAFAGRRGTYGNFVSVESLTETGQTVLTNFAHLSEILVKKGDEVLSGDIVGRVGSTGRSTGPHLHYEVKVNGKFVDPAEIANILGMRATPGPTGGRGPALAVQQLIDESDYFVLSLQKQQFNLDNAADSYKELKLTAFETWQVLYAGIQPYLDSLRSLGPDGELVASVVEGANRMMYAISAFTESIKQNGASIENLGALMSAALTTVQSITSAAANARIANIDREIDAEKRRDGTSAESVRKLEEFEKKKDKIAKKQFDLNKKLSMAQTIIATATGVAEALKYGPIAGPILAAAIGALGAAQLAIISKTQYQSTVDNGAGQVSPASLSIGKRGNEVDLASGPSRFAGGEIGYLRGSSGYGTGAGDFQTIGSAYGGSLMRGYGNRGFVVGEKGPETIIPEVPVSVTPSDEVQNSNAVNATFNIHAIDSKGVEQVLLGQRGNLISMLREAANASGERFLEDVDVNVYTTPNISRL